MRIALANLRYPDSPDDAVVRVTSALARAEGARIMCFPECYVPGYRGLGHAPPAVDEAWLERAWSQIGEAARAAKCAAIVGTERFIAGKLVASVLVVDANNKHQKNQNKNQNKPDEEGTY